MSIRGQRGGCERRPIAARWATKVSPEPNTGCWLWVGCCNNDGYGTIGAGGVSARGTALMTTAHRASWEIHHGPIPAGTKVLHRCDVPACVNPDHLFLGSSADNTRDAIAKGRHIRPCPRGEDHPDAKLTAEEVRQIRSLAGSVKQRTLAALYGISSGNVADIIRRRTWRHV